jgi:NifB/MoaA-like Fe-S oxidoreductase
VRRRLLRNPKAPAILAQLAMFAAGGIQFHTQIVLVPGLNDGPVLERSLADLWAMGDDVLSVSVVPVALTSFSRHDLVRQLSAAEARAAVAVVERWQARARAEREGGWVYGSDELYMTADLPFPPADAYDGFAQVENGVGAVRYLEQLVQREAAQVADLEGRRVLVCTGTAMGRLMPNLFPALQQATRATFELAVLENTYFGPSVTTAGLLPGEAFRRALEGRADVHLALLPAEAVNEDGLFVDDLPLAAVEAGAPMPLALSYHFTDALVPEAAA